MRRVVSILDINDLLRRVKAAFSVILARWRRVERLNGNRSLENFSVVWRWRAAQTAGGAIRA